jgi:UDP-glucuronate 4-epimerase
MIFQFDTNNPLFTKPVLITGTAGFIGYHVADYLLSRNIAVHGIDSVNDYYDINLKYARLNNLKKYSNFTFEQIDLADNIAIENCFKNIEPKGVIHLAAQAGVRYSLTNPHAYMQSNIIGFLNILEGCRHHKVNHCVFASSSSVYGANTLMPFSVHHNVDHPVSLYAATKKSNELTAHSYANMYGIPLTGLRFFTVYGEWGRPDMAIFMFTKAILEGTPIKVFNNGDMYRDFTYIADIVEGVVRTFLNSAKSNMYWNSDAPDPATSLAPYKIYNIGNHQPVKLADMIAMLENILGIEAIKEYHPMQIGDVKSTYANIDTLQKDVGFSPSTPLEEGLNKFVTWYNFFYS